MFTLILANFTRLEPAISNLLLACFFFNLGVMLVHYSVFRHRHFVLVRPQKFGSFSLDMVLRGLAYAMFGFYESFVVTFFRPSPDQVLAQHALVADLLATSEIQFPGYALAQESHIV
jgi:hypothetical protein